MMTRLRSRVLPLALALALLAAAGCATEPTIPVGKEVTLERTTFSFDQNRNTYDLFPEYRIAAGDVLDVLFQIRTWLEKADFKLAVDHEIQVSFLQTPELNTQQRIRPDGTISLPYLGVVRVVGQTVEQLTEELRGRYAKILRVPDLLVVVPDFRASIKELKADLHTAPRGLSRLVTVRPDGYVTFPMVGDVFVAGKTIPAVNTELNQMYEKVLPDLHCDLFLETHSGSVIYVTGMVTRPGSFPISKPVSVLQALTMAGTPLTGAQLDNVMVVRRHGDKMVATRVDLQANLKVAEGTGHFFLLPDDIVYVPKSRITETAELARAIGDIIFFRGWSASIGWSWSIHDAVPSRTGSF